MVTQTQAALDVARAGKLPKLVSDLNARLTRYVKACSQTQEMVTELEVAVQKADSSQRDLLEESRKENVAPDKAPRK